VERGKLGEQGGGRHGGQHRELLYEQVFAGARRFVKSLQGRLRGRSPGRRHEQAGTGARVHVRHRAEH
jgi:hypothetical protein